MMHSKMTTTDQLALRNGVKCVIYGRPGTGKTRLIASCPRPMIISAEKGLLSLREYRIPVWETDSMPALIEAYQWVFSSAEARNFDTIAMDSISDVAEVLLSHEKRTNTDKRNQFKPYNELLEQIMNMLRQFRALPQKHVYFIAKEEHDKAEGGMLMFQPSMPGQQLTRQVPYLVDEIFRLVQYNDGSNGEQVAIQCHGTATAIAKDRSGRLAAYEPYDLGAIFGKIMA